MLSPPIGDIVDRLESSAAEHGFPLIGIAAAEEAPETFQRLCKWLEDGYHGTMSYLETRRDAYQHPKFVLEECQSVIMMAMPYAANPETVPNRGSQPLSGSQTKATDARVGNYAIGQVDYHDFIRSKLNLITADLKEFAPGSHWRGVIDTAPLLERDYAKKAGLGWTGKNTLLLNREWGSYFFLAAILTDLRLPPTEVDTFDHCGSCRACLDACPTDAFVQPRVLDATRCISYLTIELKGPVEAELRPQMQNWIFGCDVCQIVCPWNRKRNDEHLQVFAPHNADLKTSLSHWLTLDEEEFRKHYKRTPFWRTRLHGMQRNALIAAGNTNRFDLLPQIGILEESLDATVSETARWAKIMILRSKCDASESSQDAF